MLTRVKVRVSFVIIGLAITSIASGQPTATYKPTDTDIVDGTLLPHPELLLYPLSSEQTYTFGGSWSVGSAQQIIDITTARDGYVYLAVLLNTGSISIEKYSPYGAFISEIDRLVPVEQGDTVGIWSSVRLLDLAPTQDGGIYSLVNSKGTWIYAGGSTAQGGSWDDTEVRRYGPNGSLISCIPVPSDWFEIELDYRGRLLSLTQNYISLNVEVGPAFMALSCWRLPSQGQYHDLECDPLGSCFLRYGNTVNIYRSFLPNSFESTAFVLSSSFEVVNPGCFGGGVVEIGSSGLVFVSSGACIQCYRGNGELFFDLEGEFFNPSIAVSPSSILYIAEKDLSRVQYYMPPDDLLELGVPGSGNGEFDLPSDVSIGPNGTVYIADTYNRRIQILTDGGLYLGEFGSANSQGLDYSPLVSPVSVEVDSDGTIFVADPGSRRILSFNDGGESLRGQWGSEIEGFNPQGIDKADRAVYIADQGNDCIRVFECYTGTQLRTWGSEDGTAGRLYLPNAIAVNPNGYVYVTDSRPRVQYYTHEGRYVGSWGSFGSDPGQFINPVGIAIGPNGWVWVVDMSNNRVQYFTANGRYLGEIIVEGEPWTVDVDSFGVVYVVYTTECKVVRYYPFLHYMPSS